MLICRVGWKKDCLLNEASITSSSATDLSSSSIFLSSSILINQSSWILLASSISVSSRYSGTPSLYCTVLITFYMSESSLVRILSPCILTNHTAICVENASTSTLYSLLAHKVKSSR